MVNIDFFSLRVSNNACIPYEQHISKRRTASLYNKKKLSDLKGSDNISSGGHIYYIYSGVIAANLEVSFSLPFFTMDLDSVAESIELSDKYHLLTYPPSSSSIPVKASSKFPIYRKLDGHICYTNTIKGDYNVA